MSMLGFIECDSAECVMRGTQHRSDDCILQPIRYVAGFLFSLDRSHVALVLKQKPAWQLGKLNAIGGKIEPGESAREAMNREFAEESGVSGIDWKGTAVLRGPDFQVSFFHAFDDQVWRVQTMETEEIEIHQVDELMCSPARMLPNLPALMAIALDESGIIKPVRLFDGVSQERKAA